MDIQNLEPAFNDLMNFVRSIVQEHKANGLVVPDLMLIQKHIPTDLKITETGVSVTRSEQHIIQKKDWRRASYRIFDIINKSPQLQTFREKLPNIEGKNFDSQIESAIPKIVERHLDGESLSQSDLLDFFLKSLAYIPVPAWCTIDVHGISLKNIPSFSFAIGNRRFIFRQLSAADFEQEHQAFDPVNPGFGMLWMNRPHCILRIEMDACVPYDFQVESSKAVVLLRLFKVCSANFGRQAWETVSPFTMLKGAIQAGPASFQATHDIVLTLESAGKLEQFWNFVEPKLPDELREISGKKNTSLGIAYERYCDSLLTSHPIERKIAFAIMGLEAIYLPENEVQELMYRLQLKVCKTMSKLDFKSKEVRSDLKIGYKIRNLHVHGGHLSQKEKEKYETKGTAVNELASRLLDYLRISILHLIVSNQEKAAFLDLLEDSFIERNQDDWLQKILETEKGILRI